MKYQRQGQSVSPRNLQSTERKEREAAVTKEIHGKIFGLSEWKQWKNWFGLTVNGYVYKVEIKEVGRRGNGNNVQEGQGEDLST